MEDRTFVIKHKKCKSILTIKAQSFNKSIADERRGEIPILCPCCGIKINLNIFKELIDAYEKADKELKSDEEDGFTIHEISGNICAKEIEL
jgi:hypothetical protein